MAKKTAKNLKAGASAQNSAEVPAFSVSEDLPLSPFLFVLERGEGDALLTKMMEAMGLHRPHVFVSHEVQDLAVLEKQIQSMKPKIVITLGEAAAKLLLGHEAPIAELRGKIHQHQGMKVVSTFHPAFMLKTPAAKKECWEDLQYAMKEIGWKRS